VSPNSIQYYAHLLERNGNLKEALEKYQLAAEINPRLGQDHFAQALYKSGQFDRAAAEFEMYCLSEREPEIAADFKRQYPVLGYAKAEFAARRSLLHHRLEQLQQRSAKSEYASPGAFVQVYAQLQNRDETLRYLEQAYREHSPVVLMLKTEVFDFLRGD